MEQLQLAGKHVSSTKKTWFDPFEAAYLRDIFYEFPALAEFTFGEGHWNNTLSCAATRKSRIVSPFNDSMKASLLRYCGGKVVSA